MDSKLGANNNNRNQNASIEVVIIDDAPISMSNNKHKMVGLYDQFVSTILVNFHAGYFRISLALSAQVLLWKTLVRFTKEKNHSNNSHMHYPIMLMSLPSTATTLLWSMALVVLVSLSFLYALRCLHHFDKVKDEFLHHVGVNYLFAPWVSFLLLLQTSPIIVVLDGSIYQQLTWWVFVLPIILLDIKLYGQWFIKGKRVLAKVANPACQLSVIANLVAAKEAIFMGWEEVALCFFALSMAHYLVLFVTLYQRHPENDGVSAKLRPVFFLFIATPSMASLTWKSITGTFDITSKMLFFLSIFLFMSLACRPALFRKSLRKFSVAWWSFSFPLTVLALASVGYAQEVRDGVAQILALVLSVISMIVSITLMVVSTIRINSLFLATQSNPNAN